MRRYQPTILWNGGNDGYRLPGILFRKGEVLELVGEWSEASEIYQSNVEWAEGHCQERVLAENLLRLGTIQFNCGQYDLASEALEKAGELFARLGDDYQQGRALGIIGTILGDRKDLKKSWEYYERQGLSDDDRMRGIAACNKGVNRLKAGEFDRAWQYLSESLELFRRAGERRNASMVLSNLGLVRKNLGDLDGAEALYREAMGIASEIGDLEGIARVTGTIGVILKLRGKFEEARECYRRQMEVAGRIGDYKSQAAALLGLGILLAEVGQPNLALEHFEKRLALERDSGDAAGTCYTLGNIGLLYRQMGEPGRSAEYLEQAIAQCRTTGQRSLLATYLYYLSSGLFSEGRAAEAKPMMTEGLEISEQLGLYDLRFNFRLLEARLLAADDRAAALKILEALEAEAATPARSAALAYELALLSKNPRDIDTAIKMYEELCAANPRIEWKKVLEELKAMSGNKSYRNSEE